MEEIEIVVAAKTPVIAPHPDKDVIMSVRKQMEKEYADKAKDEKDREELLEKVRHVDRVFLRDNEGKAFVLGGFLRGMVNAYLSRKGEKIANVEILPGYIEGDIAIMSQMRKEGLWNPEVLMPGGKIKFKVRGEGKELKKFAEQVTRASEEVSLGAYRSRGYGIVEIQINVLPK